MDGITQKIVDSSSAIYECSPSQVATYELCARKWAWAWIDGLKPPQNKFAAAGTRIHSYLEKWLKKRVPPSGTPEAKVAQIMLPHLPPPHLVKPEHVEFDVGITLDGIRFILGIDVWMPDLDPPRVYDHKSTSSATFDWALTPESMPDDIQATLYAAWGFVATQSPVIDVQWTYGRTKGAPEARPVRATLEPHMIEPRLLQSIKSAKEMKAILESETSAINVPYDASGCEAFGGCPFQDKCNLTPNDRLESIMSQGTGTVREDYLAKLKAQKAKNGAAAATTSKPAATSVKAGQVNPPAVTDAGAAAKPNKLAARLAAKKSAEQPAPEAPAEEAQPEPEVEAEAEAAAEEAPRRRGRPAGSTAQPKATTPNDQWAAFVNAALPGLMKGLELEDLADADMQEGIAQTAAGFADNLLKEYLSRFS